MSLHLWNLVGEEAASWTEKPELRQSWQLHPVEQAVHAATRSLSDTSHFSIGADFAFGSDDEVCKRWRTTAFEACLKAYLHALFLAAGVVLEMHVSLRSETFVLTDQQYNPDDDVERKFPCLLYPLHNFPVTAALTHDPTCKFPPQPVDVDVDSNAIPYCLRHSAKQITACGREVAILRRYAQFNLKVRRKVRELQARFMRFLTRKDALLSRVVATHTSTTHVVTDASAHGRALETLDNAASMFRQMKDAIAHERAGVEDATPPSMIVMDKTQIQARAPHHALSSAIAQFADLHSSSSSIGEIVPYIRIQRSSARPQGEEEGRRVANALELPLAVALAEHVQKPLAHAMSRVASDCAHLFLRTIQLERFLVLVKGVYLFGERSTLGPFFDRVYNSLSYGLPTTSVTSQFLGDDKMLLQDSQYLTMEFRRAIVRGIDEGLIAEGLFSTKIPGTDYTPLDLLSMNFQYHSAQSTSRLRDVTDLRVFGHLGVEWHVCWPVDEVITARALRHYNALLQYFMQVDFTYRAVAQAHRHLTVLFKAASQTARRGYTSILDQFIHAHTIQLASMRTTTRAISDFVLSQANVTLWHKMRRALRKCKSLREIRLVHKRYLKNLETICCIMKPEILDAFQFALNYVHHLPEFMQLLEPLLERDRGELSQPEQTKFQTSSRALDQCYFAFEKVMTKIVRELSRVCDDSFSRCAFSVTRF